MEKLNNKKQIDLLFLIFVILLILASTYFLIDSYKVLKGEGFGWIFRLIEQGDFQYDRPFKRFIYFIDQAPAYFFRNFFFEFISPLDLTNIFKYTIAIHFIAYPLFFFYQYLKTNNGFYLNGLFLFLLVCLGTDSYYILLANITCMFLWLLFDINLHVKSVKRNLILNIFLIFLLTYSYELSLIAMPLFLLLNYVKRNQQPPWAFHTKTFLYSAHFIIQILSILLVEDTYHTVTVLEESIYLWPSGSGILIFFCLFLYVIGALLLKSKKRRIQFELIGLLTILVLFVLNIGEINIKLDDSFMMRFWLIPVFCVLSVTYFFSKKATTMPLLLSTAIIFSFLSIRSSLQYKEGIDFLQSIPRKDQDCKILSDTDKKILTDHGHILWNTVYKDLSLRKNKFVKNIITTSDTADKENHNCKDNIPFGHLFLKGFFQYDESILMKINP